MVITHKVKIDLEEQKETPSIMAAQGDSFTRRIEFSLFAHGEPWPVPEGAAVAYDGISGKGIYDTLPDGNPACMVAENAVTVTLVPQVVRMPGRTSVSVVFSDADGKQLATFCVEVHVESNPSVGAAEPEDYVNMRRWVVDEAEQMVHKLVAAGTLNGPQGEAGVGIMSIRQAASSQDDGGENVVTVTLTSGEKMVFTVKNGSRGPAGAAQVPLFANSTEECTDTDKLYVLPDGYIYAYMPAPVGDYSNVLPLAVSEIGGTEIYEGVGYKADTRMGSGATISAAPGMCLSGIISQWDENGTLMPLDGAVIRIKNITVTGSQTAYLISCGIDGTASAQSISIIGQPDDNGVYCFTVPNKQWYGLRLSVGTIDETSIVTITRRLRVIHSSPGRTLTFGTTRAMLLCPQIMKTEFAGWRIPQWR